VGAAEKLEQWQKAVDAAHRANQLPPYHTRELAAWNSAAAAFEKLGVNRHELLYAKTATAQQGDEQHRREQPRQAGGRVSYEPAHDVVPDDTDTLATGAGAISDQGPPAQALRNVATRTLYHARAHWLPARAQSASKAWEAKRLSGSYKQKPVYQHFFNQDESVRQLTLSARNARSGL
jgi:hypothetical protein